MNYIIFTSIVGCNKADGLRICLTWDDKYFTSRCHCFHVICTYSIVENKRLGVACELICEGIYSHCFHHLILLVQLHEGGYSRKDMQDTYIIRKLKQNWVKKIHIGRNSEISRRIVVNWILDVENNIQRMDTKLTTTKKIGRKYIITIFDESKKHTT